VNKHERERERIRRRDRNDGSKRMELKIRTMSQGAGNDLVQQSVDTRGASCSRVLARKLLNKGIRRKQI
jgi:hypothetical protein